MLDAPVVAFRSGRGIVSNAHELGLTMASAYKLWPTTDLMIGIGTRMELPASGFRWPYQPAGIKSIRIDIDPVEMRRFTPDAPVIADAKAGTAELVAAVKKAGFSKTSGRRADDPRGLSRDAAGDPEDPAADGLPEHPARGAAVQRHRHRRTVAGRLRLLVRLSGLRAAHLHHFGLSGHARLGLPDRARRQGRQSGQAGGRDHAATAASCSRCRNWRPPCSSRSAW